MTVRLDARPVEWELNEPFRISRGEMTHVAGIVVTVTDEAGRQGRGEAYGIIYEGETPSSMLQQISRICDQLLADPTRDALLNLLPYGGARCAVDCALWDLEARQSGRPAWQLAGLVKWERPTSAYTIGMRPLEELAAAITPRASYPLLKIKVADTDPMRTISIARQAAPNARLIVDPNQSWTFDQLREYAPQCRELGVVLLEQPLSGAADGPLAGYDCPVAICADEIVHVREDLLKVAGKYDYINIKLDKSGGLTAGLQLATAAVAQGLRLMVGCMAGSSLAMAPAVILAQMCDFVDLDGPMLQRSDWPHGLRYEQGCMSLPTSQLWG